MKKIFPYFLILCFLVCSICLAGEVSTSASNEYKKAVALLEKGNKKKADFWLARYLAKTAAPDPRLLDNYLKKRNLKPSGFLSPQFDAGFIDWFSKASFSQWNAAEEKINENVRSMECLFAANESYYVSVVMTPEIQTWFRWDEAKPIFVATASGAESPVIYTGKWINQKPLVQFPGLRLETGKHALQYFWTPELYDLDGDGVPEIWVRYNLAGNNGFAQILEIYKINEDRELVLFKRFKGDFEGAARRLDNNKVEVLTGQGSSLEMAHRDFDEDLVEVFAWQAGDFKRISTQKIPHILKSQEWKKYYLGDKMQ